MNRQLADPQVQQNAALALTIPVMNPCHDVVLGEELALGLFRMPCNEAVGLLPEQGKAGRRIVSYAWQSFPDVTWLAMRRGSELYQMQTALSLWFAKVSSIDFL